MEAQWLADRTTLRTLVRTHPQWRVQALAEAVGRSRSWVKKWRQRLRAAPADDDAVLHSRSRARKHPPPKVSSAVIARILEIRDQPPRHLQRTPGPEAILYYLHHDDVPVAPPDQLPRSTRTIWRILHQHDRIAAPRPRRSTAVARPAPLTVWQLDFKDASTVLADPDGKQQHVVEVLNTVDAGTSLLLNAQPRADFTAETTLAAVAETLRLHGLPAAVMCDRDSRFVGSTHQRDCPSPFMRFWLCLGVQVTVLPPRRPDLNGFVERFHRSYDAECLRVFRPRDLLQVCKVTARYQAHYNLERPHQGRACGNQPPQVALAARADVAPRPALPALVDPDRWLVAVDGQRFVRKVTADTSISLDGVRYYITQALVGQYVSLRVDGARGALVVEHAEREVKRLAIKGLGRGPLPFDVYLTQMCMEARAERFRHRSFGNQLPLALDS